MGTSSDLINLTGVATVGGVFTVNIAGLAGAATGTAYTFFDASSGLSTNDFAAGAITAGGGITSSDTMTFALSGSDVTVTLNAPAVSSPALAYWTGTNSTSWTNAGNFNTTNSGGTALSSISSSTTDVVFATTSPTPTNLSTTLDRATTINSLLFTTSSNVSIAGSTTNTLTLEAATTTSSNGINVAPNGIIDSTNTGTVTISAPVILGTNQTWTNSSTTPSPSAARSPAASA